MKKSFACLGTVLALLCSLALPAMAQEAEDSTCGENLTWTLEDGTLTVTGTGAMYDFPEGAPWQAFRQEIRAVKLEGGVTYVGENAFSDFDSLTALDLGSSLTEAGRASFTGCDGLTAVSMPASFRIFGEESFSHCSQLKEFRFAGAMPSFKLNCLWDTYATLIYPGENPWPLQHLQQLEEAFQGRIEFIGSDGTDPILPEEPETQPVTEAPAEAPTEIPTEAPTQAPTETEPPTQAATEAPAEPPAQTETQPPLETRPAVPELPQYVELPEPEEGMSAGMKVLIGVMAASALGIVVMVIVLIAGRNREIDQLEDAFHDDFDDLPRPGQKIPRTGIPPREKRPSQAEKEVGKQRKSGKKKP